MATRRVKPLSRRAVLALSLLGFVLVAMGVITRRWYGFRQASEIESLEQRVDALAGERAQLEGSIRDASSRARLEPIARTKLNMRIPAPDHVIMLPRRSMVDGDSATPAKARRQ